MLVFYRATEETSLNQEKIKQKKYQRFLLIIILFHTYTYSSLIFLMLFDRLYCLQNLNMLFCPRYTSQKKVIWLKKTIIN